MNRRYSRLKGVKWTYLLLAALWLLAGLALLIWPNFSSRAVCRILGILCVLYGVVKLIGYFAKDPYRLAFQFDLALGIFCIVLGCVLLFFSRAVLSLLPVIVGIFSVVSGVFKLQTAFEAKRFGMRKWWGLLILSLAVMAVGVVLLVRPFATAMLAFRLIGVAMMINGVQDVTATAYTVKTKPNGIVIDVDDFREV